MNGSLQSLVDNGNCRIRLLDDTEISFNFKRDTLGSGLLDFVCKELNLVEKDYFGLRFVDNNKQRHWLPLEKEISKQLKECRQPFMFFFRVKFYPTDPTKLGEEITRYQLYLQLKRDILHGRLLCPFNNVTDLAAHVVQAELGDYDEEELGKDYLKNLKLLPRQNEKLLEKIAEYHKELKGYVPVEAENRFLNLARSQDLYGVDPHPCKDQDELPLYLGLTPHGIQIIREARRVSGFVWSEIAKVSYDNKSFYIQTLSIDKKKNNYVFCLSDTPSSKHLWKCTVEHMAFYSEDNVKTHIGKKSVLSPQNFFRRSKHKYSGKTEHDLKLEVDNVKRADPPKFKRNKSLRLSAVVTLRENFSNQSLNKNRLSMPNLEALQQALQNERASDCDSSDSISETASTHEKLSEFKTETFPDLIDNDSASSAQEDSDTSSQVAATTAANNNENGEFFVAKNLAPEIKVENVDDQDTQEKSAEEVQEKNEEPLEEREEVDSIAAITSRDIEHPSSRQASKSSTATTDTLCFSSPTFVLILVALIMIPLAVVLNKVLA